MAAVLLLLRLFVNKFNYHTMNLYDAHTWPERQCCSFPAIYRLSGFF